MGCVIARHDNVLCWNPNPTGTFAIAECAHTNGPNHRKDIQLGFC